MFKDLLVPVIHEASEAAPMTMALALAAHFDAHVAVQITVDVPVPIATEWGAMAYGVYAQLHADARQRAEEVAARLRERFARAQAPVEVRLVESLFLHAAMTAVQHARYSDLAIIPSAPSGRADSGPVHDYFVDLLIESGTPVLVVPARHVAAVPPKKIVIAWHPSRSAVRAVHDAMPLLRAAESVDVLMIDPVIAEGGHGEQPGADIAGHLLHHGLQVQVTTRPRLGLSVAGAILDYARHGGADLIVAGGYGHSRLREFILGGVTRELLQTTDVPILFSH